MAGKCSAIARSGSRCSAPVLPGSSFCFLHAPEMAEARREAGRKGGKARSAQARARKLLPEAMDAAEIARALTKLLQSTIEGKTEPKVAHAVAALAKILLDANAIAAQPHLDDLQEQVDTLRLLIEGQGRVA